MAKKTYLSGVKVHAKIEPAGATSGFTAWEFDGTATEAIIDQNFETNETCIRLRNYLKTPKENNMYEHKRDGFGRTERFILDCLTDKEFIELLARSCADNSNNSDSQLMYTSERLQKIASERFSNE